MASQVSELQNHLHDKCLNIPSFDPNQSPVVTTSKFKQLIGIEDIVTAT